MKKTLILLSILTSFVASAQSIEISPNGGTNASAILDLKSTTKGFLLPRMTNAQMRAIPSPAQGLLAFCTDCGTNGDYYFYKGTDWVALGSTTVSVSTTMGSVSANADEKGATITNGVLNLAPANATKPGIITATDQTFGGVKTFSNGIVGNVTGNAGTATKIASITNADIVQLTSTQTLTNKTLTSPTITGTGAIAGTFTGNLTGNASTATTATTATNISGGAAGSIPYQTATGSTSLLAAGSSGQVLTSTGLGTLTWATASSSGVDLTTDQTIAGAKTFSAAPVLSSTTASKALFTDANKNIVSNEITGTGNVVMSNSPALVTPALGTPSAAVLTYATGLPLTSGAGVTGTLPVANGGTGTTNGSITGTGALTFAAGGSNQNISITPSGTGSVGIGTSSPNTTAALDVTSTTKGFLPPRLSSVQRNDITNPTEGLVIYNSTKHCLEIYRGAGGGWFNLCDNAFVGRPINKLLGGSSDERASYIQKTSDEGYIISGYSYSSANGDVSGTNHGGYDYWIVKLDALGNIIWNKLLGGIYDDYARHIQQTSDGGYIISGYSSSSANGDVSGANHGGSDYWIVKLDALGNIVWNKLLGGNSNEESSNIQQTSDGGYIISGLSTSSANGDVSGTNHGGADYWIVKLDALGNIVWNKLLGGIGTETASNIQQTTDGGYIISGWSTSSANGDVSGTNHGFRDYWIVKLDALGNIVWNKLLGGNSNEESSNIQQTSDGGYIISGYSSSSANGDVSGTNHGYSDYWIVKLDALGNIIWNKLLGGNRSEESSNIQQTSDGGYIISGLSTSSANGDVSGTNHGGADSWIVKLDALGNIVWNKLLGGSYDDYARHIQQTSDGGYIISGYSSSSANGDVSGTNHGSNDYWIVTLDALGNILLF
jgi:hypothetical protein